MNKNDERIYNYFNINDFTNKLKRIKDEILLKNNLIIDIDEADIKIFIFLIKNFGKKIIYNLNYISKDKLIYVIDKKRNKKFFDKLISLLFLFLYSQDKINQITNEELVNKYERYFKNLYKILFNIIDNIYFSSKNNNTNNNLILEVSDIFELIRLNLLLGLDELLNKSYIFNETIHYLIKIYFYNENNKNIKSLLKSIIFQIYTNLLNSEKNLHYLRRDQNLYNLSILEITKFLYSSQIDSKILDLILELLTLIYKRNYSSLISDYILDRIKESFYEIKENNLKRIIDSIKNIYGLTYFLNNLFIQEENEKHDPYEPSSYFVFGESDYSGINYNPSIPLLKKAFTIIFSFKINEIKDNFIYPILSFVTHGEKNEIILFIYIHNQKLKIFCEGDSKSKEIENIHANKYYLVIIEYKIFSFLKDKIKIYINDKIYEKNSNNINDKSLCSLQIGYLSQKKTSKKVFKNIRHFNGIIGPIIQFSNVYEDKDFIPNVLKLKGKYDLILLLNKNVNLDDYSKYDEYQYSYNSEIESAKNYFIGFSKKFEDDFQYSICPMSMINNINQDTYYFCQDIYNRTTKQISKEVFPDFHTLSFPSSKCLATYAKKNQKSLSSFAEYDGIYIYTLIVEYFYNVLKMLINVPKEEKYDLVKEIYKVLSLIKIAMFKILKFFRLNHFSDTIDTFGFSIKKLFGILIDIRPLNDSLINDIVLYGKQLTTYCEELSPSNQTKKIILNFLGKFITLIFSPKYINISNYSNLEKLFAFINSLMKNNHDLINENFLSGLVSFSFVLDSLSFDMINNNEIGTTSSSNEEFKNMKKEYKNLIITFIENSNNLKLYFNYLENIFNNQGTSWTEKYGLLKLYYLNHKVQSLYSDKEYKDSNNFLLNIFKKEKSNKKNIFSEKDILKEYQSYLLKLIEIPPPFDSKSETSLELIKTIFILLIYEHKIIIPLNIFNENKEISSTRFKRSETKKSTIKSEEYNKEDITFFSSSSIGQIKNVQTQNFNFKQSLSSNYIGTSLGKIDENESSNDKLFSDYSSEDKDASTQASEAQENKNNINNNKENYLFDALLNTKNISFYTIKGFFMCLCDKLDKKRKISFIKNQEDVFESFKDYIGKYDRYKKQLFFQFLCLIECINNETVLEKSLKLIFSFIKDCLFIHNIDPSDKINKEIFIHLLESKTIFNRFFGYCLNNTILTTKEFKKYIIDSIKYINKNSFLNHPRPYIFSFIKRLVKNKNEETFLIIDDIIKFILESIKSKNPRLNYIFDQNLLRFINTLVTILEKYSNNFTKLLLKNNYELFYSIQNFVEEIAQMDIIYDPNLYVIHPYLISQSKEEKKDSKIFQSHKTKLLNNQIIFINIFQISLNSIYLLWKSQNQDKELINICLNYISKIHNKMLVNDEYISFFLDLSNPFFKISNKSKAKSIPEKISKIVNNNINDKGKNKNFSFVRESRIISFSLFLMIMKFQSFLINYSKTIINDKTGMDLIIKAFAPLISLCQNEIQFLIANIGKMKDNKNFEIIMEKEESRSKEFKDYNKNYYKNFLEKLKTKNFDINSIKDEIETKFETDEYQRYRISINLLKNENNISYNEQKAEKKEKNRKDSFVDYNEEKEIPEEKHNINKTKGDNKNINEQKNINNDEMNSLDFENAKYPILCTKRDIILKNFGYFYYKYYFKNNKFIKLRKLFIYKFDPNIKNNNFHGYEKTMKNKYPFTNKNFSNCNLYYPRVFSRPYNKFFDNKFFKITHSYFKTEKFEKNNKEKILHLEYGHGLLKQSNFDLYILSNKNESMNDSRNSSFSKGSDDDVNIFNLGTILESLERNKTFMPDDSSFKKHNSQKSINKGSLFLQKNATFAPSLSSNKFNNNISSKKNENNNIYTFKFECEKISPKSVTNGFVNLGNNFLIFQSNKKFDKRQYNDDSFYILGGSEYDLDQSEKQIIIQYNSISQILYRRFLFNEIAIEIFLYNGKSYYFNFYNKENKDNFMKIMSEKIKVDKIIKDSDEYFGKKKYSNQWLEGKLSTLDYLLLINKFSDRSYNVLSQYLILPWILSSFENIYNPENIRNFQFTVALKSQEELNKIRMENEWEDYTCHFSNFFSNYMYVNHYLFRTYPYINNQIKLQDGKLDEPSRQFNSIGTSFKIFYENPHINLELVPEFYFIPEFFMNLNYCNYGSFFLNGEHWLINNLGIGPDFHQVLELINYHQLNINSENIISQINKWIDNVFGENQIATKKNDINYFPKECYKKYVNEIFDEEIQKIKSTNPSKYKGDLVRLRTFGSENVEKNLASQIKKSKKTIKDILYKSYFYGQCPTQLFSKSHPSFIKKTEPKIYNFSNMSNFQIILKNALLIFEGKDILYMHESSNGNYLYIVYENEILVYNKNLKFINNLSLYNINKIPNCFSFKYHTNDNRFKNLYNYQYIIFDIFDCKFFFIGGYMDNSLRIYFKDKEKDIMYSLYSDSQIKCIINSENDNTFFTGHENGKIAKWSFQVNNDYNDINIKKENSIRGHKSSVKMIKLNEKYECIISIDIDEIVFIRKIYDFELLSYIKFNKYNKKVIDVNIYNQIIILTIFKIKTNEIFLYTYTLNGLNLAKIREQLKLPISLIPNTDEMIILSLANIYFVKVAFNEKTSLLPISNDLDISNIGLTSEEDNSIVNNFNNDLHSSDAISYFYDSKNRVLFCLFSEGKLYRINFVKNA